MSIFNLFKQEKTIGGEIAYHKLGEWWLKTFNKQERDYIIKTFQPLGGSGDSLIKGEIQYSTGSSVSLLSNLAGWFKNVEDREIGYKLLKKAEMLIDSKTEVLDVHFFYQNKLEFYYRFRDIDSNSLSIAIDACKKQIELAPKAVLSFKKEYADEKLPMHTGYEQLTIVLEKQAKYNEAISLCEQAKKQAWNGEWDKRIKRCIKKKSKQC
jgi:tetratricopeptide (TPR) repeat protein